MRIATVGAPATEHRRYLGWATWAAFSVILGVLYVSLPRWIDHRWNDYLGSALLEGGRPYVDVGANDFPGLFILHALALGLFGYHDWSFRLFDYLLLLGFVLVLGRTLAARQGAREALIFVPLYQLIYVTAGYGISGQRDLLAAHLDLVAGALLLWRIRGGHRAWLVPAGLAVLTAALLKPTYALFAPALPLIDLVARRQSGRPLQRIAADHAVWAMTAGAALAVLVAIGWRLDMIGAWYEWTIAWNGEVYSRISRLYPAALFVRTSGILLSFWPVYTAVALVGGLLWWSSGDRPLLVLLLATALTTIASVTLQGKLYYYHIAALLPVLAVLMTHALAWASRALAAGRPASVRAAGLVALAALMVLMTTLAIAKKVVSTYRIPIAWHLGRISEEEYLKAYNLVGVYEVAAYVRAHTTPQDTVWSLADDIVDLYLLARRKPPSRFCNPLFIFTAVPPFSAAERWQAEMADMMQNHPPKMIVTSVIDGPPRRFQYPPVQSKAPISALINEALATRYQPVKRIDQYEIYERIR